MNEKIKSQISPSIVIPANAPNWNLHRKYDSEPTQLSKYYLVKNLLKTASSIQDGSITIIKQDNHIIQVNIKEIIVL